MIEARKHRAVIAERRRKNSREGIEAHPFVMQLAQERLRLGVTIKQIAHEADVSIESIDRWELGKVNPSLASFERWANAIGFQVSLKRILTPLEAKLMSVLNTHKGGLPSRELVQLVYGEPRNPVCIHLLVASIRRKGYTIKATKGKNGRLQV